jgi:hypothetical protein
MKKKKVRLKWLFVAASPEGKDLHQVAQQQKFPSG